MTPILMPDTLPSSSEQSRSVASPTPAPISLYDFECIDSPWLHRSVSADGKNVVRRSPERDVAAETLLFSGLHLDSDEAIDGSVIYWLVVAAICAFIAYGRFVLEPFGKDKKRA